MAERDEEEAERSDGFTVRDKRRFDSSGNERRDEVKSLASQETASPERPVSTESDSTNRSAPSSSAGIGDERTPALDFASFIWSLATQALWQLGADSPPEGMAVEKDRDAAKQTIEIISLLKTKTTGNLTTDEERLIEEVLHQLRMVFVRSAR